MKYYLPLLASLAAGGCLAAAEPANLNRQNGVKLTADSHLYNYRAGFAADGNDTDKASRWVSDSTTPTHWLEAAYPAPVRVNTVSLKFWNDQHVAVDFDIEGKINGQWRVLRSVRNNAEELRRITFPSVKVEALRVRFLKMIPDDMVRIYEFTAADLPHAIEAELSSLRGKGFLEKGEKRFLMLRNYDETPVRLQVKTTLRNAPPYPEKTLSTTSQNVDFKGERTLPLPTPTAYGSYAADVEVLTAEGKTVLVREERFFYFPPAEPRFRSSSPFGVHYHHTGDALVDYVGFSWWRDHDNYGRWNQCVNGDGTPAWARYEERLAHVSKNQIRECAVFLGAPRKYSTILPGEKASSDLDSLYSYYPPSDLDAWIEQYVKIQVDLVKKASPFRAYEIWNEAWSYYRLRGLHGTPGEAMQLFRLTYDAAKKADPEALVYPTDTKPEAMENQYAFKNFGRDMFELGYLRWADLLSYHSYGMMSYEWLEKFRRNMWEFGRDLAMWTTETAASGSFVAPYHRLMESQLTHRINGNDKAFIYNGANWAPLYKDGQVHLNLVAMSAMIRTLGDALPLGKVETPEIRTYLLGNNSRLTAILFTDSPKPLKINTPLTSDSTITDIFGTKLDPAQPVLTQTSPVIVQDPAPALLRQLVTAQIDFYAEQVYSPAAKAELHRIAQSLRKSKDFRATVAQELKQLTLMRGKADSEMLYGTNFALDTLTACEILFARGANETPKSGSSIKELRKAIAAQWSRIRQKTQDNGILPDAERLTSRAQKEMQFAQQYDSDNDAVAREIWLKRAVADLENGAARIDSEKLSAVYKTKSYFRSHKRLIRSELYCFPNGRSQEAVITLANPLGHELEAELFAELPAGWSCKPTKIKCTVPALSRVLLPISVTAPDRIEPGKQYVLKFRDAKGHFPELRVDCEILKKIPPFPVLGGAISSGTYTGN